MITKDIPSNILSNIPRNIPRNIRNNFLKNNIFNYDSFALENKTMITKDIPRNIRNNFLKNNTFNYNSFALENKTMIHMGKYSFNSRRISNGYPSNFWNVFRKYSWLSIYHFLRDIPKKLDVPRNIPLFLVRMKWNYYKCRMDIPQVRDHHKCL